MRSLQRGLQVPDVLGNTDMTARSPKDSIEREEGGPVRSVVLLSVVHVEFPKVPPCTLFLGTHQWVAIPAELINAVEIS